MNNLEKWVNGQPIPRISTYELLRETLCKHAEKDYVFFPILIGYVNNFLNEEKITSEVKKCVLQLLFDLLTKDKLTMFFVSSNSMIRATWKSESEAWQVIEEVMTAWNSLGQKEPEMNDIVWLSRD